MTNRPKLVHISSSLARGGAERVLCTLVAGLRDTFDQAIIYLHDGPLRAEIEALGIVTYQLKGVWHRYDPFFFVRLYRLLRMLQPDGIHTMLWAANVAGRLVARLLRIPVVCAYHNNVIQDGMVRQLLDMLTINRATKIIAVSDQVAAGLYARFIGVKRHVAVINNGIMPTQWLPAYDRALLDIAEDAWIIGAVGRFVSLKRFEQLFDAVALLVQQQLPVHLLIIGHGPLYTAYQERVKRLQIVAHVTFVINQPAQAYMPLFDCFVQPSEMEGISLALLEAMAARRVCIVCASDAKHPVIVDGQDGLCVAVSSAAVLADKIAYAYQQRAQCAHLAQAAADKALADYGQQNMINKYAKEFFGIMRSDRN